jgi:hypothetical protein
MGKCERKSKDEESLRESLRGSLNPKGKINGKKMAKRAKEV